MLKIAVCDDNPVFLKEMQTILSEFPQVGAASFFAAPQDLLMAASETAPDLVLLDLQFGEGFNGLDWAEKLYHVAPDAKVICVTGYNDRYAQRVLLHQFNLLGYLTKPVDRDVLQQYLDKALARQQNCDYLSFSSRGRSYSIATASIVYLESRNHTVKLYTRDETFEFYEKLSCLQDRLPQSFILCHKSYLVNLGQVTRLEPDYLALSSGARVPISRACRSRVQEAFFHYIGQNI